MAYVTIPQGIMNALTANWALVATTPVGVTRIHFDVGWVDRKQLRATNITAQVIVSGPIAGSIRYFGPDVVAGVVAPGLRLLTYHRYVVNIWVPIPAGDERTVWDEYAEEIRFEIIRILNEVRSGFAAIPPGCPVIMFEIPLDAGRALHELDVTARILRYEITIQVDTMS